MSVTRLVPLHAVALTSDPQIARMGDLYYNTTDNALKFHDGSQWHQVGGGVISGLLNHVHTYDGAIHSVFDNQIPSNGIIDGALVGSTATPDSDSIDGGLANESSNEIYDGGTP